MEKKLKLVHFKCGEVFFGCVWQTKTLKRNQLEIGYVVRSANGEPGMSKTHGSMVHVAGPLAAINGVITTSTW